MLTQCVVIYIYLYSWDTSFDGFVSKGKQKYSTINRYFIGSKIDFGKNNEIKYPRKGVPMKINMSNVHRNFQKGTKY